jgi:hypothetical protein
VAGVADHSLRFDDSTLQERFIAALISQEVQFELGLNRAVECTKAQWDGVNSVAHTIRDGCFRWYFSWWDTPELTGRFLKVLRKSGLPFQLEHHENRDIFLLSKQHEAAYLELSAQV